MSIVKQNPFRVLGLTGNSSERELQKQIGIIKRYVEIGKSKTFDYDFEFMGDFSRKLEDIQKAASQIEQAKNKLHYALFWFISDSKYDEIALSNLKDQNIEKANEIWEKTVRAEISNKNYSSYLNLSTLYIALSTIDGKLDIQKLQKGIDLKGIMINSISIKDFSKLVTGNGSDIDATTINKKFIDEIIELLKSYLDKKNGISSNELFSLFSSYPKNIQNYLSGKFTEVPLSNIENKIEKSIGKRKKNPKEANECGEELYKNTKTDISLLKKLLGGDNLQFQVIANKIANEIIQCSIEFFNKFREENGDFDPGDEALRIAKLAKSLRPTGQIKQRIEENTAIMKQWVDDKPNRQKQEVVKEDLTFVINKLQSFQNLSNTIKNAKDLIVSCKPKLAKIKKQLGVSDDFYLQISSGVVNNALGMIIIIVNDAQSGIQYNQAKLLALPAKISSALGVINLISRLDMSAQVRDNFNKNKSVISSINNQIRAVQNRSQTSTSGCYLATMVYGDYNHPQVLELRKVRDEILAYSIVGRRFISFYYSTSPKLVRVLKNHKRINEIIRSLLDKLIKYMI